MRELATIAEFGQAGFAELGTVDQYDRSIGAASWLARLYEEHVAVVEPLVL